MENIITKESEENKSDIDLKNAYSIQRRHYSFLIKVTVLIAYAAIDIFYSFTSFQILFGRRPEIFYVKILFALIGVLIFFRMIDKWRDGKNFYLARRSVFVLFSFFVVGNSADIILEHIIFNLLIHKTVSAHYFLLVYGFILAFVLISIFTFYSKKMDNTEQTTNFYIPIVIKLASLAFLFIFFVGSIFVARSVTIEERNAILMASEVMKTQMSVINGNVNKYLNSVNTALQHNVYLIDKTLHKNEKVNINIIQEYVENDLYIYDNEAAIDFSSLSLSINTNYTVNGEPLSLVFDIASNSVIKKSYYNSVLPNERRYTGTRELSDIFGLRTFIKYVDLREGLFDLSFIKQVSVNEDNIGYVQASTSGIHLGDIVSQFLQEDYGQIYALYGSSDNTVYSSSKDDYLGISVSSINSTEKWISFLDTMKSQKNKILYIDSTSILSAEKQKVLVVGINIPVLDSTLVYMIPEDSVLREFSRENRVFVAFSVILLLMILFVIIFSLMTRSVIVPITVATHSSDILRKGSGDLRQRIFTNSNDEVGVLIVNFNEFISGLDSLIQNLKGESYRVRGEVLIMDNVVKESAKRVNDQTASITESVSSINNIITSISNVGSSTDQQRHAFSSASIAVEDLLQTIHRISENMERQSAAVEETSVSIEEMISNITSVSKSVNKADNFSKKLLDDAREGGDTVDEVIEAIHEIEESSDQIKEIINVIQGIAEQTNLLAMNAAIEAAHAGEQGKGFAVVADEIRSLAEHTADNTKSITLIIKDITKRVERTVDLAVYSGKSLDNILDTSVNTARVISEINIANTEFEVGGRDILETLKHLNDITFQVKENVKEQINSGDVVDSQITLLDQITREVSDAIEVNTMGAKDIVDAMTFLNDLAEKTRQGNEVFSDAIKRLNDNFKRFNSLIDDFVTDERDDKIAEEKYENISDENKTKRNFDIDDLILNQDKLIESSMSVMEKAIKESPVVEDDDTILKILQDEFENTDFFDKK